MTSGPADLARTVAALLGADDAARPALLDAAAVDPAALALALKASFDDHESSDVALAHAAARALAALAALHPDATLIGGLAAWVGGMAAQIDGRLEESEPLLDAAVQRLESQGHPELAAQAQVSRLMTLAMRGDYDAALAAGHAARAVFLAANDQLAAGKIEQNIGNIAFRRDRYAEAERWYRSAHDRFLPLDDAKQLAQIDNCLATARKWQHDLAAATALYERALGRATTAHLTMTQAEIEGNLGVLAMLRGDYSAGLRYLEDSRRRYAALTLPHETAYSELELADAYLECRLAPEAAALYARVGPLFAELGWRPEQARAVAGAAQAALLRDERAAAAALLATAHALYVAEENTVGAAWVQSLQASLCLASGEYAAAAALSSAASAVLRAAEAWPRAVLTEWIAAEALRLLGDPRAAVVAEAALAAANARAIAAASYRCWTTVGLLRRSSGALPAAEAAFRESISVGETLRATLPSTELRAAFVGDKQAAYQALIALDLAAQTAARTAAAWQTAERAKARALLDRLGARPAPAGTHADPLDTRLAELRGELNWLYRQAYLPEAPPSPAAQAELSTGIAAREAAVADVTRQLAATRAATWQTGALPTSAAVAALLDAETVLVEYMGVEGRLVAWVLNHRAELSVYELGSEPEIAALLDQLYLQIGSLRHGGGAAGAQLERRTARITAHLQALHRQLIAPFAAQLAARVVVVPHGALFAVPFHALHDGRGPLQDRHEIIVAPSAAVLAHCLTRPAPQSRRALCVGVPDPRIPDVAREIALVAATFDDATVLWDDAATGAALAAHATEAAVLHLACHGFFRPDNPLFSALQLHAEFLTVYDLAQLRLPNSLVVLSACESGRSAVLAGDELLGLAHGFLEAGATTLVVSLWPVDDATTAALMADFYAGLRAGLRPGAALRAAQQLRAAAQPHPFFWAPFVVIGRP